MGKIRNFSQKISKNHKFSQRVAEKTHCVKLGYSPHPTHIYSLVKPIRKFPVNFRLFPLKCPFDEFGIFPAIPLRNVRFFSVFRPNLHFSRSFDKIDVFFSFRYTLSKFSISISPIFQSDNRFFIIFRIEC